MSKPLEDMIRLAILAHNAEHAGEFLTCRDAVCLELRIDLLQLVCDEALMDRLREAKVPA